MSHVRWHVSGAILASKRPVRVCCWEERIWQVRLWRFVGAVVLFTSVGVSAAGAGAGAPPPPGPRATIVAQNPDPMTKQFLTLNLKAQIASCSQLTQSNRVVASRGGRYPK
jgi:hypothetical protein